MIRRPIIAAFVIAGAFSIGLANTQQAKSYKSFATFSNVVPDIDFYASNRKEVTPYEKPLEDVITRLKGLLGKELPNGAIFICSTLEQKDAVYEPKVLRMGYRWSLTAVTPAVRSQEMLARIKSQMGGEVPAEIKDRIQKMQPEMMANAEKQMAATLSQQVAHAVIQTMMNKDLQFRSSRVDDMGKSPLPDWLDIGIASYASGTDSALSYLKQNMDQTFPIEDVLSMARPFVASSVGQNGGSGGMGRSGNGSSGGFPGGGMPGGGMPGGGMPGGGMPGGGMPGGGMPGGGEGNFSGRGMGGFGGSSGMSGGFPRGGSGNMGGFGGSEGQRGRQQRTMSKDEQDRMLFDGQASTFFSFLMEKIGLDKVKEMVKEAQEGKESREYLIKPDVLGPNFSKTEEDWVAWVKSQK